MIRAFRPVRIASAVMRRACTAIPLSASVSSTINFNYSSQQLQYRCFSDAIDRIKNLEDFSLGDSLVQESLYEAEQLEQVDQELLDSIEHVQSLGYTIKDELGKGIVELTRDYKEGEKITIKIDCQAEANMENQNMSMDEMERQINANESGDHYDQKIEFGMDFVVTLEKHDMKVVVDCTASDNLKINCIRNVPAGLEEMDYLEFYGGPTFWDLEETLQSQFYEWLAERGIDDNMSVFVLNKCRDKEQKEYLHWLRSMTVFVG